MFEGRKHKITPQLSHSELKLLQDLMPAFGPSPGFIVTVVLNSLRVVHHTRVKCTSRPDSSRPSRDGLKIPRLLVTSLSRCNLKQ